MLYELFYLIGASNEADTEKIKEIVEKIVTSKEGEFEEKEVLEKRRMSYKIKKETHGIYIARRFEISDVEKIKEIRNKLNLEGSIMRFIISRASELPELKSKEERMSDAKEKEHIDRSRKAAGEKDKEKELEKNEGNKEKEKTSEKTGNEDIDKKLEEILNI
jgi:ribosomal protein S6